MTRRKCAGFFLPLGYVHGDLHEGNVLVSNHGLKKSKVSIIDWGEARPLARLHNADFLGDDSATRDTEEMRAVLQRCWEDYLEPFTHWTVYTRAGCKFCRLAKERLARAGIRFDEIADGAAARMRRLLPWTTTVPQIVDDIGHYVGGYDPGLVQRLGDGSVAETRPHESVAKHTHTCSDGSCERTKCAGGICRIAP